MHAVGTAPCAVDFLPRRRPRAARRAAPTGSRPVPPPPPPYAPASPPAPRRAEPPAPGAAVAAALRHFAARAALSPSETRQRHELIAAVRRGVAELWGDAPPRVVAYGSFALGVSTPASDIDLTVLFDAKAEDSAGNAKGAMAEGDAEVRCRMETEAKNMRRLYQISQKLTAMGFGVKVYEFCRVPVANVRDPFSNLTCDINVGLHSVEKALSRQRKWLEQHEEARGLILVTKAVLKQWGLNSLFHGGLSSTALYVFVYRFIEERHRSGLKYFKHGSKESSSGKMPNATTTNTNMTTTTTTTTGVALERGLHPSLLLDFWGYASTDVFLTGCLFDVFATENGEPPAGARDLTAGSYRLPEVLALFHNLAMLLDDAMTDYPRAMFRTGGLGAIFADPRQDQGKRDLHVLSAGNTNAAGNALKRQCISPQLNGKKKSTLIV